MTTPGPWKVGDREPYVEIWGRMSMNASPIIASMEHEPRKENAEFIVRAVNAFQPMLDALNASRLYVETLEKHLDPVTDPAAPTIREHAAMVRAAIAKATGT